VSVHPCGRKRQYLSRRAEVDGSRYGCSGSNQSQLQIAATAYNASLPSPPRHGLASAAFNQAPALVADGGLYQRAAITTATGHLTKYAGL
jgi:hypothetical protein